MGAGGVFETWATICQTTRRHILQLRGVNSQQLLGRKISCGLAGLQKCQILKMGAGGVFKTWVTIPQTTRRHIPQFRRDNSQQLLGRQISCGLAGL
jgi:hypothetical protein